MQVIRIKKGYRFRVAGPPANELVTLSDPDLVALLPDKIPHIKPKLQVAKGDSVQIGSHLFSDKRNPAIHFSSPAGGTITDIHFGPRRTIQSIVIKRQSHNEPQVRFPAIPASELKKMDRDRVVAQILEAGLWWIFRELPFRDMPNPASIPPLIVVRLSAKEPFQPSADVYLQDRSDLLGYGLQVLHKLADGRVMVYADTDDQALIQHCGKWLTHTVSGYYPADDPGTVVYHTKKSVQQNRAWYIAGQDVLLLAQLLAQGRYPIERIVTVAGSGAPGARQHYRTRLGTPLGHLVDTVALNGRNRLIVGGMLTGYAAEKNGFIGLLETAVNIVPEGGRAEFLALFNPGFSKPTYSRTFLSRFNPGLLTYDCNLNGGQRACIACMHCADVCPVDILPQMAYKAILAEEVEEYLELGLLDCVECGLCSYVCPSKIDLSQTFRDTKAAYAREIGRSDAQ